MKLEVTTPRATSYPDPIRFKAGDRIKLTGRTDSEFPGWEWIRLADGKEGWAPSAFLTPTESGSAAIADRSYDATELEIEPGQVLLAVEEIGGWIRCEADEGLFGWVSRTHVKPIEERR